jgi:hypothetical protein
MDIQFFELTNTLGLIPVGISILALILSLISLWRSHLAPFKLKVAYDAPHFCIYKYEIGKDLWWIPSIDLGMTFHNVGSRSGQVLDVRALLRLEDKDGRITIYPFYPQWIVDYKKFNSIQRKRFQWLNEAVARKWYPIFLSPKKQVSYHIVLEKMPWEVIREGFLTLELQVFSTQKRNWKTIHNFSVGIPLTKAVYEGSESYGFFDDRIDAIRKKGVGHLKTDVDSRTTSAVALEYSDIQPRKFTRILRRLMSSFSKYISSKLKVR